MMQSGHLTADVSSLIAEVLVAGSIVSFRRKQREIADSAVQTSHSLQSSLLYPVAAVHHFDWRLRGGL